MRRGAALSRRQVGVSIHASVKDATGVDGMIIPDLVSIHASVKDATAGQADRYSSDRHVSIHASVKDATDFEPFAFRINEVSIHASVKDATSRASDDR